MLKNELYEQLVPGLHAMHQPEEKLLLLFKLIAEKIPFTSLYCHTIHRKTGKISIHIASNADGEFRMNYSLLMPHIINREKVYESFVDKENKINLRFDTKNDPEVWNQNLQGYKGEYRASLLMLLKDDVLNDLFHCLFVASTNPNQFNKKHVEILGALRGSIKELTSRYFTKSFDPYLVHTLAGPLPTGAEALLRRCPGLSSIMQKINVLAESDSTILIQGPTGSGKELIAETLHMRSKRLRKPFVKVNCGSIPETLVDSSFFGFEKGAFTGATVTRQGYFEQAHEGTLYLDEIGELSFNAQVSLLRVLETKEIQRIGGNRLIPLDLRFVAATHRDLWAMVEKGTFREDLYYRLTIYPLLVPPLSARIEDIPTLVEYFYALYIRQFDVKPPPPLLMETVERLKHCHWPGNVRQLRYAMERAVLDAKIQVSNGQKPSLNFASLCGKDSLIVSNKLRERHAPDFAMKKSIVEALVLSKGRIHGPNGAAAQLGLNPSTLRSRMKRLAIPFSKENQIDES